MLKNFNVVKSVAYSTNRPLKKFWKSFHGHNNTILLSTLPVLAVCTVKYSLDHFAWHMPHIYQPRTSWYAVWAEKYVVGKFQRDKISTVNYCLGISGLIWVRSMWTRWYVRFHEISREDQNSKFFETFRASLKEAKGCSTRRRRISRKQFSRGLD